MRVLHFYKTYKPDSYGGVEQLIWQLCTSAPKYGIESNVLTVSKAHGSVCLENHNHYRIRQDFSIASTNFSFNAISTFRRYVSEADIVHYHFPYPFADLLHFTSGIDKPTIVTYHSDIVKQRKLLAIYRPLMLRFLDRVDKIIATSSNYLESSEVLKNYKYKTEVIPIGIDQDSYPDPDNERIQKWQNRIGQRFFLFLGNLRYYKGLDVLLAALRNTSYPVVIAGSGREEAALKAQAKDLNLKSVIFLGEITELDKISLLKLTEAMVFPSNFRSEAFGISLLEAAMYGKPMISCEIGTGTSFVNINNCTGIVVPPNDVNALRSALDYIWENRVKAAEWGRNARLRYEKMFTGETMTSLYASTYKALLK